MKEFFQNFKLSLDVSMEDTQKKLDKALKRNLGSNQQPQIAVTTTKTVYK